MQVIDFNIINYVFIFEIYLILLLKVYDYIYSNIIQILIKIIASCHSIKDFYDCFEDSKYLLRKLIW